MNLCRSSPFITDDTGYFSASQLSTNRPLPVSHSTQAMLLIAPHFSLISVVHKKDINVSLWYFVPWFSLQTEYEDGVITDFKRLRQKVCVYITMGSFRCFVSGSIVFAEGGREQGESSA